MKPRKPLTRTTPLRANTGLPRTGGLKRGPVKPRRDPCGKDGCNRLQHGKGMCRVHYDRARANVPMSPEERAARKALRLRSQGLCEACGAARAREYQHRKAAAHCSPVERWDLANALHVCGHGNIENLGCHGVIHSHPTQAYANGWSVRSSLSPADIPCLRRGQLVWLRSDGTYTPALGDAA